MTVPLNQSYRIASTLANRPEVQLEVDAYERWRVVRQPPHQGRWYDYAVALARVNFQDREVLELGARDSFFSPYVTGWAKSVTVTDLLDRGSMSQWRDTWYRLATRPERLKVPSQPVDMRRTGFDANAFDVVVNISAIEHLPAGRDDVLAMEEMARIVRPGGFVIIGTDTAEVLTRYSGLYYDERALYERLIEPSGLSLYGPTDLSWGPCDKSLHKSRLFERSCAIFTLWKPHE